MRHFLTLRDFGKKELTHLVKKSIEMKRRPNRFAHSMKNRNLVMVFEAPSLRTRLSFEIGMTQMGGHGIFYHLDQSTLGKKESVQEFSRVVSRYADMIMARVFDHGLVERIADYSKVPVINGMTNFSHPCQVLSDLMTIYEKKKTYDLKLAYLGDGFNNVTHSLLYGCSIMGMNISVACPKGSEFEPAHSVMKEAVQFALKSGSSVEVTHDPREAARDADIIYTDSWMSYHIHKDQESRRVKIFEPFQVNAQLMRHTKMDALFMHDLPATRGREVTDDVMDCEQSIVIDQAENRLHAQKALMLWLMKQK